MKRIILILTFSLLAISVFAQEHLSFKGIPIEGSMTSFCKKLKAKGFTHIITEDNFRVFTGDFTGREVAVGVISTSDTKEVFSVIVMLPENDEWKNLVNTYEYYKDLYVKKYGSPYFLREYNPARDDSNISLMSEVHQGTVTYVSSWKVSGGTIELSIQKTPLAVYEGQVVIRYIDAQNTEAKIKQDLEDI